jgi:hypothetical protein
MDGLCLVCYLERRVDGISKQAVKPTNYHLLFPAFFAFAHLALAAAETAALQAALLWILGFRTVLPCAAILFATPARMLANPCALIFLLGFCAGLAEGAVPLIFAHLAI